jgi:hypothetical protein
MNVPVRQSSTLALVSLIAGILGWTLAPFIGNLVAVITGHMARKEIRLNPAMEGSGFATAGLVLGWVGLVFWTLGILLFVLLFGGLAWLGFQNV